MKKLALFLATQKGFCVLQELCCSDYKNNIACVISFNEIGVQKDWAIDIEKLCEDKQIPFYYWKDVKTNLLEFIRKYAVTSVIAISWRYLLPLSLNDILEDDIIVFHDSLLPKYRGFAPVVTAMLCRENVIGATALFATDKVDAGDIILQKKLSIRNDEYIAQIFEKMAELYASMAVDIVKKIVTASLNAVPQNESEASYSIWRDEEDYKIDWSMDSVDIYNQIRATGYPYRYSFTYIDGELIRIVSADIEKDFNFALRDYGKIWNLNNGEPLVICGKGILRITKAAHENGTEYKFTKLRSRLR